MTAVNSGKTILLTGAGGWVGSALAKSLVASAPRILVLLGGAERNLHQIHSGPAVEGSSGDYCEMKAVGLGNGLASKGSIVPLLLEQISRGVPATVADPEVTSYSMTLNEVVELMLAAAELTKGDCILVPELGEPIKTPEFARQLIQRASRRPEKDIPIVFTGLRPRDKLAEEPASPSETLEPTADGRFRHLSGPAVSPDGFDAAIAKIQEDVCARDVTSLLETLCRLVRQFEPDETSLGFLNRSQAAAT